MFSQSFPLLVPTTRCPVSGAVTARLVHSKSKFKPTDPDDTDACCKTTYIHMPVYRTPHVRVVPVNGALAA